MPRFFKMLDLSTCHLPEELGQELDQMPGVIANHREYGWLLWVPDDIDDHVAENAVDGPEYAIPDAIITIWRYAEKHECQFVLFDSAADTEPDLPSYDW
jgi:hypothetical protein